MADAQTDGTDEDDVDIAPAADGATDVGVTSNPRRNGGGRPHVRKPREAARIRPEGDADRDDTSDDDEADDAPKSSPKGKKKSADDEKEGAEDKRPLYQKPVFWVFMALLVAGAVVGLLYYLHARDYESTDDAFIEGHVVQISPQVSAKVLKVYIDDNTHVSEGDPLVELDPTDYQVALAQAKGDENNAQGKLEQAKATVESSKASRDEAKANLDSAETQFENADRNLKRYEALDDRARSKQQLDDAVTTQKNNAAQVNVAKAKLASAESQIAVDVAQVAAAEGQYETNVANRKRAEVNLGYCHVTAPAAGRVTSKNVDPGMYASTGQPMFSVVRDDVWVVANYKETQLTDMRVGQAVTMTVDAYPGYELRGQVQSLQAGTGSRFSVIPAENATGNYVKVVQRVPVKIVFDQSQVTDKDHVLGPGMSVVPSIKVR